MELHVEPRCAELERPRRVWVSEAQPGRVIRLRATTLRNGVPWYADISYLADRDGFIDTATQAPVAGDLGRIDPMGLWTAQLSDDARADPWPVQVIEPLHTEVVAYQEDLAGEALARVKVEQELLSAGVGRSEIRQNGLVGTLFTPPGPGPHPLVVVLNGSGGGINEARAARYAAHGIQALALGYFKAPGLPDVIVDTPLEYFETALRWAHQQLQPANHRLFLAGQSRGGELSLLLASRFPQLVHGVIALVPAAFVYGAQGAAGRAGWDSAAWTWQGEALPHMWQQNPGVDWQPWGGAAPPQRYRNVFLDSVRDARFAAAHRIEVERITGPVLCISGMDDQAWPSSYFSRLVVAAIREAGGVAEHLDCPDAGHAIGLPNLPSTQLARNHPVSGVPYRNGGTPQGNARAAVAAFERSLDFLYRYA